MAQTAMHDQQYDIVAKALDWQAGDIAELDELCDLLMTAAAELDEDQSVRTASSILLANKTKLPTLHHAI